MCSSTVTVTTERHQVVIISHTGYYIGTSEWFDKTNWIMFKDIINIGVANRPTLVPL